MIERHSRHARILLTLLILGFIALWVWSAMLNWQLSRQWDDAAGELTTAKHEYALTYEHAMSISLHTGEEDAYDPATVADLQQWLADPEGERLVEWKPGTKPSSSTELDAGIHRISDVTERLRRRTKTGGTLASLVEESVGTKLRVGSIG